MSSLIALLPLALFSIFTLATITYVTFGVERAPKFLQPLLRHVAKAVDALDELIDAERQAQLMQQGHPITLAPDPVNESSELLRKPAASKTQTRQSPGEARFFQLQEMAIACNFEPRIVNGELEVTGRELSRLRDYCALGLDVPQSVEEFLRPLGLKVRKQKARRRK